MDPIVKLVIIAAIIIAIVIVIVKNIKIVPQAHAYVIERLGTYQTTWNTGLHLKVPFVDRIAKKLSLKEQVVDFAPQPVITKDNVTMQIDTVVYYQITDPKLYTYGVERPLSAIENLTATTLRNIIGDLELDATLTSRDTINDKIRTILDTATDPWGIRVIRVELKNILPPKEIQDAMEKQMKAERERRAKILEAIKESKVREAQGEAEAIMLVQKAQADALKLLNEAKPIEEVLQLKSYETFQKVADGQSTKIIIPSDIKPLATAATAIKEIISNDNK